MSALTFLSNDSYGRFNIELAHQLGLEASIYIEAVLAINAKAQRKNAINEQGYFKIDRKYVEEKTTLPKTKQVELDNVLARIEIISIDSTNKDVVYLNTDKLMNLSLNLEQIKKENIALIESKRVKSKLKDSKDEAIKSTLYYEVTCVDKELQVAYCNWINEVFSLKTITKSTVKKAQEDIDTMCVTPDGTHDLDKALELIKIATANHYIDMTFALKVYNELKKNLTTDRQSQVKGGIKKATAPTVPVGVDINLFDKSKQF